MIFTFEVFLGDNVEMETEESFWTPGTECGEISIYLGGIEDFLGVYHSISCCISNCIDTRVTVSILQMHDLHIDCDGASLAAHNCSNLQLNHSRTFWPHF